MIFANKQRYIIALLLVMLSGCASFNPEPLVDGPHPSQRESGESGGMLAEAAILSDEQARKVFGVDLADVGLQATWLRVENRTDHEHWLLVSAFDANYFAPDEAAALFHPVLSNEDDVRVTEHFRDLSIPLKAPPNEITEGYILAPRKEGGRYASFEFFGAHEETVKFGFALPLPNGEFDYEQLNVHRLLDGEHPAEVDLDELVKILQTEVPCCSKNAEGSRDGDPLNLAFVGEPHTVMSALSRAGWSFTHKIDSNTIWRMVAATLSGEAYPVAPISPLYFSERPQDIAMQRARATIVQRNHLRLWLLPVFHKGQHTWVGQVSRDIGIKATTLSPTLTTHVIDPNVDEAREHLLQTLLIAGAVERFGFVEGGTLSTPENPSVNLTNDPYYSDGMRLFIEFAPDFNVAPKNVEFIDWHKVDSPMNKVRHHHP